jgi:hypothetical protein
MSAFEIGIVECCHWPSPDAAKRSRPIRVVHIRPGYARSCHILAQLQVEQRSHPTAKSSGDRNPIYLGMFMALIGLAMVFDNPWLLMMLVPFALVIRYGVVAREEVYLERKFGDVYRGYRSRVRRWL